MSSQLPNNLKVTTLAFKRCPECAGLVLNLAVVVLVGVMVINHASMTDVATLLLALKALFSQNIPRRKVERKGEM